MLVCVATRTISTLKSRVFLAILVTVLCPNWDWLRTTATITQIKVLYKYCRTLAAYQTLLDFIHMWADIVPINHSIVLWSVPSAHPATWALTLNPEHPTNPTDPTNPNPNPGSA